MMKTPFELEVCIRGKGRNFILPRAAPGNVESAMLRLKWLEQTKQASLDDVAAARALLASIADASA